MKTNKLSVLGVACLATAMAVATPIRLGTWNIRLASMDKWEKDPRFPKWEARMPKVVEAIEGKGFDLMGLQEVATPQAEFLRRALPEWGLVGVATNDVERARYGHANGILYRKDRFSVSRWGCFALSTTPDVPGSSAWGSKCVRSCTWAILEDRLDARAIMFFDTHLDHRSQEAREKGMALVLENIARANDRGLPVILTGDFNSTNGSPQIAAAKSALWRAYEHSEKPPTGPVRTDNCWKYRSPSEETDGQRIDHIFLAPGTRVMSHETFGDSYGDGFYPSDHFPVKVVIEFSAESETNAKKAN